MKKPSEPDELLSIKKSQEIENDDSIKIDVESEPNELVHIKVADETTKRSSTISSFKLSNLNDEIVVDIEGTDANVDDSNKDQPCVQNERNTYRVYWTFRRPSRPPNPPETQREPSTRKFYKMASTIPPRGDPAPSRGEFVRLTFFICAIMLAWTTFFVSAAYNIGPIRRFLHTILGIIILVICALVSCAISYAYALSECSRNSPVNYILNFIEVLCISYITSFLCVRYAPFIILGAVVTTLVVVLFCLGLAYTSFDFTKCILVVMVAGLALFVASIFAFVLRFFVDPETFTIIRLVILIVAAVLNSVMLVIEFQMILGGKEVELGEEEYVFAAYLIYGSIMSLFLQILQILGQFGDD